jgi:hypothetical protein
MSVMTVTQKKTKNKMMLIVFKSNVVFGKESAKYIRTFVTGISANFVAKYEMKKDNKMKGKCGKSWRKFDTLSTFMAYLINFLQTHYFLHKRLTFYTRGTSYTKPLY